MQFIYQVKLISLQQIVPAREMQQTMQHDRWQQVVPTKTKDQPLHKKDTLFQQIKIQFCIRS